jgi:hypothetical protein
MMNWRWSAVVDEWGDELDLSQTGFSFYSNLIGYLFLVGIYYTEPNPLLNRFCPLIWRSFRCQTTLPATACLWAF